MGQPTAVALPSGSYGGPASWSSSSLYGGGAECLQPRSATATPSPFSASAAQAGRTGGFMDMEVAWVWPPCLPCQTGVVQLAVQVRPLVAKSSQGKPAPATPAAAGSSGWAPLVASTQHLRLQVLHMGRVLHSVPVRTSGAVLLSFSLPQDLQPSPPPPPQHPAPQQCKHSTAAAASHSDSGTSSSRDAGCPASAAAAAGVAGGAKFAGVLSLVLASEVGVGPALPLLVLDRGAAEDFQVLFRALVDEELGRQGRAAAEEGEEEEEEGAGSDDASDMSTPDVADARSTTSGDSSGSGSESSGGWRGGKGAGGLTPPLNPSPGGPSPQQQQQRRRRAASPPPHHPRRRAAAASRLDRVTLLVQSELQRSSMDSGLQRWGRPRPDFWGLAASGVAAAAEAPPAAASVPLGGGGAAAGRVDGVEAAFRAVWSRELLLLVTDLQYLLLCVPDAFGAGAAWDCSMYLRTLSALLDQLRGRRMWAAMAFLLRHVSAHGLEVLDEAAPLGPAALTPAHLQRVLGGTSATSSTSARGHSGGERRSMSSSGALERGGGLHVGHHPPQRRAALWQQPWVFEQFRQQQQSQQAAARVHRLARISSNAALPEELVQGSEAGAAAPSSPTSSAGGASGHTWVFRPAGDSKGGATPPSTPTAAPAHSSAASASKVVRVVGLRVAALAAEEGRCGRVRRCSAPPMLGLPQHHLRLTQPLPPAASAGQQAEQEGLPGSAGADAASSMGGVSPGTWSPGASSDCSECGGSSEGMGRSPQNTSRSCPAPAPWGQPGMDGDSMDGHSSGGSSPLAAAHGRPLPSFGGWDLAGTGQSREEGAACQSGVRAAQCRAAALALLQSLEWLPQLAVAVVLLYCLCGLPMMLPSLQAFGAVGAGGGGADGATRLSPSDWCPALLAPLVILHCLLGDKLGEGGPGAAPSRHHLPLLALHRVTAAAAMVLAAHGVRCMGVEGMQQVVTALVRGW